MLDQIKYPNLLPGSIIRAVIRSSSGDSERWAYFVIFHAPGSYLNALRLPGGHATGFVGIGEFVALDATNHYGSTISFDDYRNSVNHERQVKEIHPDSQYIFIEKITA